MVLGGNEKQVEVDGALVLQFLDNGVFRKFIEMDVKLREEYVKGMKKAIKAGGVIVLPPYIDIKVIHHREEFGTGEIKYKVQEYKRVVKREDAGGDHGL